MLLSLLHVFVVFVCMFVAQVSLELTVAHASLKLVSGLLVLSSLVLGLQVWSSAPRELRAGALFKGRLDLQPLSPTPAHPHGLGMTLNVSLVFFPWLF